MKPERWQQIDSILKSALELPSEERAAYLDKACARDKELRREVESLIGHEQATGFLETQAFEDAARLLARDTSHALVGETLGSYKILSALGAGGMGEVYLALHIRTNRRVALKLLPAHFNADELRVRRFQQEARAVLALNHPNIVTVYDIEQAGETYLIATELVEGETLRRRMGHEPLTLTESLDVAIQLTGALAAAHEAGIVHRDIKPENIMLRTDGYVKVLDFGLAKLLQRDGLGTDSELPTRAMVNTDPGMVMGTVNYMSPEQARGLSVDTRTDIWSLGAVLYEMVTGRTPFAGDTASDVMALILQKEPPPLVRYWSEAPEALEWIVTKTLTKERDERYQTAKELLTDLKRLKRRFEYEAEAERASIPSVNAASVSSRHQATADKTVARHINSTVETAAPRSA
jgi:serine/threonine protein kinase